VIIQQERNEWSTGWDDQVMTAVVHRQAETLVNPLTFETATSSTKIEIYAWSDFLKQAIQELPEAQKEVIHLALFQGMSQREIGTKRKNSLGTQ
jgi:DNA-directed RNA polymerase specialized sigma24 family protein